MANAAEKNKRGTDGIPVAKDKPNIFLKYRPIRSSISVPTDPLYRYETSIFAYFAYKYGIPLLLVLIYAVIALYYLLLFGIRDFAPLTALASPIQLVCAALLPFAIYIAAPIAHVIICEEGLFVRSHFGKVFVPWKYLRSYHKSKVFDPWVMVLTFYTERHRHIRIYSIISFESEHETVEILNYIRKVRREEGPGPVRI